MGRLAKLFVTLPLLLSAAGGCAADVGQGVAELGTGEWRFEALGDADDVGFVYGPQGGYHVWVSVRAAGLSPERVLMELVTEPVDGSLPPEESTVEIDLEAPPADAADGVGMHELLGWPAVVSRPGCVVDHRVRVSVTLTDVNGVTAYDERVIVPRASGTTEMPACER